MQETINYKLKKPEQNDTVDITKLNENMDILDKTLKEVDNKASTITVPVTKINNKTGDVILSATDIKTSSGQTVESQLAEKANQSNLNTTNSNLSAHIGDTTKHITATERNTWNAKQSALGFTPENSSNKGKVNGYASLGSDGKVPEIQLPDIKYYTKLGEIITGNPSVKKISFSNISKYKKLLVYYKIGFTNVSSGRYIMITFNNDINSSSYYRGGSLENMEIFTQGLCYGCFFVDNVNQLVISEYFVGTNDPNFNKTFYKGGIINSLEFISINGSDNLADNSTIEVWGCEK